MTNTEKLVRDLEMGSGPLMSLTIEQLCRIVAQYSPYGEWARDALFRQMREYADSVHPVEYKK